MNQLAYPHTIRDIINEYFYKKENLNQEIKKFYLALADINNSCAIVGGYNPEKLVNDPYVYESKGQKILLHSAWKSLYTRLNLDKVFSAKDEDLFDQMLTEPLELTMENLKSVFGDYWENPRYYILKGLVEVFCSLDKFYKSHSRFGIGVKGLPKRVILTGFCNSMSSWGSNKLIDLCRAMLQVTGEFSLKQEELSLIRDSAWQSKDFELERLGLSIKTYAIGNAHVFFNKRALIIVNDAIHEFYGDILPDETGEQPEKKQQSTEVSKDLQFYRTPKDVVKRVLGSLNIQQGGLVLEPSCGDGAILDQLVEKGYKAVGVEYDTNRANQARAKGHSVQQANFLDLHENPIYDAVVMNPPFCGKHYVKHVNHALKFLKKGGILIAILPASAWYEHELLKGQWSDLPIGSFRESGTNVNTGYLTIRNN